MLREVIKDDPSPYVKYIEYIEEDNYVEEVIKTLFEMIERPNVENDEFDLKTFNIIKERLKREINSLKENGYIFIVTAQSNIVSEFKLNKHKYCCVSEFYIDNMKVEGNKRKNNFAKDLVEQFVNN